MLQFIGFLRSPRVERRTVRVGGGRHGVRSPSAGGFGRFYAAIPYGTSSRVSCRDEAYYWNYSRHLVSDISIISAVAWLIGWVATLVREYRNSACDSAPCAAVSPHRFFPLFRLTRNLSGEASVCIGVGTRSGLAVFFLCRDAQTPDRRDRRMAASCISWSVRSLPVARALGFGQDCPWGAGASVEIPDRLAGFVDVPLHGGRPASRRWFRRWEPYTAILARGGSLPR